MYQIFTSSKPISLAKIIEMLLEQNTFILSCYTLTHTQHYFDRGGFYWAWIYSKTFYHNHNHGNWSDGPELLQARVSFAAGIVTDEATQEKLVVVTGGLGNDGISLNSTEILIGKEWSLGKKIKFQPKQVFFV